jgi:4-hydroxy-tetrahydrodipicolinate synthase
VRVEGLFVPLVTPFDDRGAVALDALEGLAAELIAGAIAASAHLCTERFARLVREHDRQDAAALLPLVRALFAEPSPAVVKAVLHRQGRIPTADLRMPLGHASGEALDRALAALDGVTAPAS